MDFQHTSSFSERETTKTQPLAVLRQPVTIRYNTLGQLYYHVLFRLCRLS